MASKISKERIKVFTSVLFIVWGFSLGYRYDALIDALFMWVISYFTFTGEKG